MLYRVSSKRNLGSIKDIHSLKKGESMTLDSVLSTSSSEKYVDTQIQRKGVGRKTHETKDVFTMDGKAINVNSLITLNPAQKEFILPKGTTIELVDIIEGVYHYDVK